MVGSGEIGAMQLSARLRGVSPPMSRRLRISEQATLAHLQRRDSQQDQCELLLGARAPPTQARLP